MKNIYIFLWSSSRWNKIIKNIYIYIYIFAGKTWLGYCPLTVCAGSRYSKLYRDTAGMGTAAGATTRSGLGHDTVEHAPRYDRDRP